VACSGGLIALPISPPPAPPRGGDYRTQPEKDKYNISEYEKVLFYSYLN